MSDGVRRPFCASSFIFWISPIVGDRRLQVRVQKESSKTPGRSSKVNKMSVCSGRHFSILVMIGFVVCVNIISPFGKAGMSRFWETWFYYVGNWRKQDTALLPAQARPQPSDGSTKPTWQRERLTSGTTKKQSFVERAECIKIPASFSLWRQGYRMPVAIFAFVGHGTPQRSHFSLTTHLCAPPV